MKNINIISRLAIGLACLLASTPGFCTNVGSPQSVKIQFFEFWVGQNADCSDLSRVYSDTGASYQDVVVGPTFGQVSIPNGTYNCVAFKMNDIVKLTPDYTSTGGNCQTGVEITRDLFRGGDTSTSPDGLTTINGSGTLPSPVENDMYVYLSTNGSDSNSGNIPSAPGKLTTPYIVTIDGNATMVFDFTNGIEDTGGSCSPETVTFGFR